MLTDMTHMESNQDIVTGEPELESIFMKIIFFHEDMLCNKVTSPNQFHMTSVFVTINQYSNKNVHMYGKFQKA